MMVRVFAILTPPPKKKSSHPHLNPKDAIGVMNFKPITKLGFVIDVMPSIVGDVTKWINVKTVVKSFVTRAQH
jgi:hypothetical protein